jgi:thiamine pyrophosphate-dependent acetolactate synthase large subunit-like protein
VVTTTPTREQAIRQILERHGREAVYVASTGYVSRAVHELAEPDYCVFYMQGSMGLAPAIGLGLALGTSRPVVVVNGDASLLMALGSTHTLRDYGPPNLFHYVLDNGCHESVGGQPCAQLEPSYPGVTEVVKVQRAGKPPRVGLTPPENTLKVKQTLASSAPPTAAVPG